MNIGKLYKGIVISLAIAVPSAFLGHRFPIIGGPIISILLGMIIGMFLQDKTSFEPGIKFVSKKILQWAVILLGFGLDLRIVAQTGKQALPIICSTIAISLISGYIMYKLLKTSSNIGILVSVGSSICGGSAIAATAPVIDAKDSEIAQSISIIFFFNVVAAIIFPILGQKMGMSHVDGDAFGIFAGTAINDTSSVTAAASTWDSIYGLGSATLDKAVTVKLTRTLAIIPITLCLALYKSKKKRVAIEEVKIEASMEEGLEHISVEKTSASFSLKKVFPFFILLFLCASLITTVANFMDFDPSVFAFFKSMSKFMIVFAMAAIGLNTDIVKLVKTGGRPLIMGAICWLSITLVSLLMQNSMNLI